MNSEFPERYRFVNPEPTSDLLNTRWDAIEELSQSSESQFLLDMVLITYGLTPRSGQNFQHFCDVFRKHDAAFRTRDAAVEHAVLAASLLDHHLEQLDFDGSVLVALAVLCVDFAGQRANDAAPWLVSAAENHLAASSVELRKPLAFDAHSPVHAQIPADIWKNIEELSQGSPPEAIKKLGSTLKAAVEHLDTVSSVNRAMVQRQLMYEEESDVLWWLVSGISKTRGLPIADLDFKESPFVIGADLAAFVRVPPGPLAIPALITSVLSKIDKQPTKPTTLQAMINATEDQWQKNVTAGVPIEQLGLFCPIHAALHESQRNRQWTGAFKTVTMLDASLKPSAVVASLQMYRECILQRLVADESEE